MTFDKMERDKEKEANRMVAYRVFLKKMTQGSLAVCLVLSAVVGVLTFPVVSLLGTYVDEENAVTTLSVLLSGFCLARLLLGLWERRPSQARPPPLSGMAMCRCRNQTSPSLAPRRAT